MTILISNVCRLLQKISARLQNTCRSYQKCDNSFNGPRVIPFWNNMRKVHDYNDSEDVEAEIESIVLYEEAPAFVRNAIYPDSKDPVINNLMNCTSIQEALDVVRMNKNQLNNQQMTQAVVTFWDLIKVLHHLNGIPETRQNVKTNSAVLQLHSNPDFKLLLSVIEKNVSNFKATDLSHIHLYLSKLGLEENHHVIKLIVEKLKPLLIKEFSLASASRFIVTSYFNYSLRSHLNIQHLIPIIYKEIDTCHTAEDIKYLTICMSTPFVFLTDEILEKYKSKINTMISDSTLQPQDFKVVLKILAFLNYHPYRNRNTELIRKCSVLIKRTISEMNASEVCLLYEIFQANQETAEILNEIQRSVRKHFLQMEEESNSNILMRLKLLSALISIASPHQRHQYHSTVAKYAKENLHPDALLMLRKILFDVKTSDRNMCNRLWDQIRHFVAKSDDRNLLKLVSEYSNFNIDIANYRHIKFENILTVLLDKEIDQGIFFMLPSVLAHLSLFYIPYSHSSQKIEKIINKLCENRNQLTSIDWFKISKAVQTAREVTNNKALDVNHCAKITKACDVYVISNIGKLDLKSINILLKSYVLREEVNNRLVDYLLFAASVNCEISSNLIKNTVYCFKNTHSFAPDVLDKMCHYICENYNHLLGTTIEKYLFFCYFANYYPNNAEKLFQVVTDVLIRDAERMNGLTYLQAALALCFFQRLPHTFIKHIFNVSFLEKLDVELTACYAKETYPFRVRHLMMQLNRAVCLDYPEANVPWFHEKYIQERRTDSRKVSYGEGIFQLQMYESLLQITGGANFVRQNVEAPYGYSVDFMIALNKGNEITDPVNGSICTQFAFVLPKVKAYLRSGQLQGRYELKRRHLEILGYKVVFINPKSWRLLVTNKDKVDYLKSIIWSDKTRKYAVTSDR